MITSLVHLAASSADGPARWLMIGSGLLLGLGIGLAFVFMRGGSPRE